MPTTSVAKTITAKPRTSIPRDPASLGPAIHPGEMLSEEFVKPLGLQQTVLARELGISKNRLNEILTGKRGVTADTSIRLSEHFGTTPQFWMRLQADWDLQVALKQRATGRRRTTRHRA